MIYCLSVSDWETSTRKDSVMGFARRSRSLVARWWFGQMHRIVEEAGASSSPSPTVTVRPPPQIIEVSYEEEQNRRGFTWAAHSQPPEKN